MRKRIAALALTAFIITGCASHGTKFDSAHVDTFQPGITTIADAMTTLGKPYSTSDMGKNGKLLQWIYVDVSGSGHVAILFRPDGTMERVTTRSGK